MKFHLMINKIRRYWKVGLGYMLGMSRVPAGPITVHIEITNICNFRCIYCPQSNPEDHFKILGRGKMDFDDYRVILDKITAAWPLRELILTRDGEPLVHPELERFISYASGKGLEVTIGSNGSYFTPQRAAALLKSGLTKIKGDFCADQAAYEKLRKGGKWEDVLQGYRAVLDKASAHKGPFHMILVDLNSYNLNSEAEIRESLRALKELFPYPEEMLSINRAVMHNSFDEAETVLSSSAQLQQKKYNLCHHPWIELIIDYRGNAVGCCRDLRSEYIIGNVLSCDDVVEEIWNGVAMRTLRRQLAKKKPENITTCNKCDLPYGVSYAGRGRLRKLIRFLGR